MIEPAPDALVRAAAHLSSVQKEIARVYMGDQEVVEILLSALVAGGHVLVEGVPGIAKTTLVKAFARTLGCSFKRIQFTPDLLPADITGTYVLNPKDSTFSLRRGPIFANIVLGDEINRAPAKTQSALLEAMQERQVTVEGETQALSPPFMVLATQNPMEQEGVYPLPEAQIDRFMVKLQLSYPTEDHEREILRTYNDAVPPVENVLAPDDIHELSTVAMGVHVEPTLHDYIVALVRFTRRHARVWVGASPRAGLALLQCAKSRAVLQGRGFLLPDDIRMLAPHVLAHRIVLTPEAELDGTPASTVIADAIASVPYEPPPGERDA